LPASFEAGNFDSPDRAMRFDCSKALKTARKRRDARFDAGAPRHFA
jgi:hypothetical protein